MHEKTTALNDTLGQASQHEDVDGRAPSTKSESLGRETTASTHDDDESQVADRLRGPAGYAHLAEFMTATHRGMVRRYREISLMNLLYLQAEIHHLKTKLDAETAADAKAAGSRGYRDYYWPALVSVDESTDVAGGKRWSIWLKLKETLYEYYDAMEKHNNMLALSRPTDENRDFVSQYIARDSWNGRRCRFLSAELRGNDPEAYAEKNLGDLVSFGGSPEPNVTLDRWIVKPIMDAAYKVYRFLPGTNGKNNSIQGDLEANHTASDPAQDPRELPYFRLVYSSNRQHRLLKKIAQAVLSILLPCAAIVSLNAVNDQNTRVGMVCGFGILFCVAMSICSSARRIEVFAATAAFMSVQLVFVGGNGSG